MALPFIVLNPRDDPRFARVARRLLDSGVATVDAMQRRLRESYPGSVVRERGLSHEPAVWYVYRDGHWVPSVAHRED